MASLVELQRELLAPDAEVAKALGLNRAIGRGFDAAFGAAPGTSTKAVRAAKVKAPRPETSQVRSNGSQRRLVRRAQRRTPQQRVASATERAMTPTLDQAETRLRGVVDDGLRNADRRIGERLDQAQDAVRAEGKRLSRRIGVGVGTGVAVGGTVPVAAHWAANRDRRSVE